MHSMGKIFQLVILVLWKKFISVFSVLYCNGPTAKSNKVQFSSKKEKCNDDWQMNLKQMSDKAPWVITQTRNPAGVTDRKNVEPKAGIEPAS